jgi:hypothetical protein
LQRRVGGRPNNARRRSRSRENQAAARRLP